MAGLTVQNWLSAGVGIIAAVALVRGIIGRTGKSLGNFWQDLVRTILYVLTPLSVVAAIVLISQGVIQNFSNYLSAHTITGLTQSIAMGPVASQEAIKLLGTNGGGFLNVNSAHPFENPTGFTNFWEMLLVLVIPAALIFMYGRMTGNRRQGYAIFGVVMFMFVSAVAVAYIAEAHGSPAQHAAGLHTHVISGSTGGNLEGKEQRFGIAGSALFDVVTTVTSCGAVNSALESFTGIGGAVPFANLSASEVIFGGVGTGLYSILLYVLLAVFIGGLMVGRTPEWLGKKLEAREVKLAGLGILITPLAALFATALAVADHAGRVSISEGALSKAGGATPQGFSESFYAYLSQANNNGSAFAGYTGFIQPNAGSGGSHGITFANLLGGFVMLFARYAPILFALAVAGALVGKRVTPAGLGTLRTDNPTFAVLLIGVIVLVGAHLLPRPAARTDRAGPYRTPLLRPTCAAT
jgi:K+-transporting ATPase ATPase A chain